MHIYGFPHKVEFIHECTARFMQSSVSLVQNYYREANGTITIGQNFSQDSWRTLVDLVRCAESWSIFWSETEKLEIFTFLVGQLLPLCTSFDCTAVSMQQRFDNLGFYTKIYKKFWLQICEAFFYFFSSSLVLFASSDSWKKTCVRIWVFSKFQIWEKI